MSHMLDAPVTVLKPSLSMRFGEYTGPYGYARYNCYAYALNAPHLQMIQPGQLGGGSASLASMQMSPETLHGLLRSDGWIHKKNADSDPAEEHLIAAFVNRYARGGYHTERRDGDGTFSGKEGSQAPTNRRFGLFKMRRPHVLMPVGYAEFVGYYAMPAAGLTLNIYSG